MLPLLLAAAIAAAPADRAYPVNGFDSVALQAPADVTIASGPAFAVRASGDPALVSRLTATVQGHALVLGLAKGRSIDGQGLRIAITMPRLSGVSISGAGNIVADRAIGQLFEAKVGGAGNVEVRSLVAAATRLTTSGAGGITIAGRTGSLYAHVTGVGSIDAARLAAKAGDVGVSGTGSITARVDGPVKVSLTGVGSVEIAGAARCEVHKMGIGSVQCGANS